MQIKEGTTEKAHGSRHARGSAMVLTVVMVALAAVAIAGIGFAALQIHDYAYRAVVLFLGAVIVSNVVCKVIARGIARSSH